MDFLQTAVLTASISATGFPQEFHGWTDHQMVNLVQEIRPWVKEHLTRKDLLSPPEQLLLACLTNNADDIDYHLNTHTPLTSLSKEAQLFEALHQSDLSAAQQALDNGANPNMTNKEIVFACHYQHDNRLCSHCRCPHKKNSTLVMGACAVAHHCQLPLFIALTNPRSFFVELLLQKGAHPNQLNFYCEHDRSETTCGMSPLAYALVYGHNNNYQLLLEYGANPNFSGIPTIDGKNYNHPLCIAIRNYDHTAVKTLLFYYADPNYGSNEKMETPTFCLRTQKSSTVLEAEQLTKILKSFLWARADFDHDCHQINHELESSWINDVIHTFNDNRWIIACTYRDLRRVEPLLPPEVIHNILSYIVGTQLKPAYTKAYKVIIAKEKQASLLLNTFKNKCSIQ